MPKRIKETERANYLGEFKQNLWQGNSCKIVEVCQGIFKRPSKYVKRVLNYFIKHNHRMGYSCSNSAASNYYYFLFHLTLVLNRLVTF